MALQYTCKNCNKMYRYDYSEFIDIGTLWHPMHLINCYGCGASNILDDGLHEWLIDNMLNTEYIPKDIFHEKWIQQYFKEHHERYGFSNIKGPFSIGPDFSGFYNGRETYIEVEWIWSNYILHKHHQNPKFENTEVMVAFNHIMPTNDVEHLVPPNIVFINHEHFYDWYNPKAKEYKDVAGKKYVTSRFFQLIVGEISKRFIQSCTDKERESAMCPDCNVCPYRQDEIDYANWALLFAQIHMDQIEQNQPLTFTEFICSIEPSEFDIFMQLIL